MKISRYIKTVLPVVKGLSVRKGMTNTYWLFLDQFIRMLAGFFVLGIITRSIGTYSFGQMNYAVAFVSLFSVLTSLGIDRIIVKDVVDDHENYKLTLGTSFYLKLAGSLLLVIASVLTSMIILDSDPVNTRLIFIFSLSSVFQTSEVIEYWYQSRLNSKDIVLVKLIAFAISSFLKIVVVLATHNVMYLAFIYLIESLISALLLFMLFKIQHGGFLCYFSKDKAKQLLEQGMPLLFASLFVTIYMKIDQVFLQYLSDSTSVGLYSAAVRISEIPFFIGTTVATAAFPLIIQAKKLSPNEYTHRFRLLLSVMVYLAAVIALLFYFFSDTLILIVFGNDFIAASEILKVHIWSLLFVFLGLAQSIWLIGEGQTKLSFIFTVFGAAINVILNLILIPIYNGSGAAIATVISYMFTAFLANFFLKRTRQLAVLQLKSLSPYIFYVEGKRRGVF